MELPFIVMNPESFFFYLSGELMWIDGGDGISNSDCWWAPHVDPQTGTDSALLVN